MSCLLIKFELVLVSLFLMISRRYSVVASHVLKMRFADRLRVKPLVLFFVLLLGVGTAEAVNPDPTQALLEMPNDSWLLVESGNVTAGQGILAFSGMTYDTVNQKILLFGGGHGDGFNNSVWAFDPNTFIWTEGEATDPLPGTQSNADGPTDTYASGLDASNFHDDYPGAIFLPFDEPPENARPLSRHTYDSTTFISTIGELFMLGNYTYGESTTIYSWGPEDTWTYNVLTDKWTYRNKDHRDKPQPNRTAAVAEYDPISDLVYVVAKFGTWTYDYKVDHVGGQNPWSLLITDGLPATQDDIFNDLDLIERGLTYDSKRQALYSFGSEYPSDNILYKYEIAGDINNPGNKWTVMPVLSAEIPPAAGGYGVVYDQRNDVVHVFQSGIEGPDNLDAGIWTYDLNTNKWSRGATGGITFPDGQAIDLPKGESSSTRTHGDFQYDPVNNVSFLVIHRNGGIETWAYKYNSGVVDDSPPSPPSDLAASNVAENQIDLSWTASTDAQSGVARYNVYRNNIRVGGSAATGYSDMGLAGAQSYEYKVTATNGAGEEGGFSNTIMVQTLSDQIAPTLVSITVLSAGQLQLVFSESVEQSSTNNAANYELDRGITINSVALGVDQRTLTLNTSDLVDGNYSLTVNNITDLAVPANMISSNSQLSFTYTANGGGNPNCSAASYVWGTLDLGEAVYIDQSFIYSVVPEQYLQASYLKTANDHSGCDNNNFFNFTVSEVTKVYVAYDVKNIAIMPPSWLSDWENTQESLVTEDLSGTTDTSLRLYMKEFPAGTTVILGGNEFGNSMYTVVVVPVSLGNGSGGGSGAATTTVGKKGGGGYADVWSILLLAIFLFYKYFSKYASQTNRKNASFC